MMTVLRNACGLGWAGSAAVALLCGCVVVWLGAGCQGVWPARTAESQADDDAADEVATVGEPPTAQASASPTGFVFPGDEVTLSGSGSDPDQGEGDRGPAWYWVQISGEAVELSGAGTTEATFTLGEDAVPGDTLGFEFQVTDADGNTATDQVFLFVPRGDGVVLAAASGPDEPVEAGEVVTLSSAGSLNLPEESAEYQWVQLDGPVVELHDADMPTAEFTAPEVETGEVVLLLRLAVINNGERDTAQVEVVVVPRSADATPPVDDEEDDAPVDADDEPAGSGDAAAGEAAYAAAGCAPCHGDDAAGVSAPNLQGPDRQTALEERFAGGGNHLGTSLTDQEIVDVAAWLATLGG